MFRDCYFTYAGQYSGDYELVMSYVENSYEKFPSGGDYEVSTDTLPATAETLLYGIKHSEKPLEFSIEITNLNEAIPFERMKEIKEWLFGQNGWKKLTLQSPDYNGCHLKCLLIPDEDIVDATGYRGVRCTLKNVSAYWYGDEKTTTLTKEELLQAKPQGHDYAILRLQVNSQSPCKIIPVIEFIPSGGYDNYDTNNNNMYLRVINRTNSSAVKMGFDSNELKKRKVEIKYGACSTFDSDRWKTELLPMHYNNNTELLYFEKGENTLSVYLDDIASNITPYSEFSIKYTPMYRIGGF